MVAIDKEKREKASIDPDPPEDDGGTPRTQVSDWIHSLDLPPKIAAKYIALFEGNSFFDFVKKNVQNTYVIFT